MARYLGRELLGAEQERTAGGLPPLKKKHKHRTAGEIRTAEKNQKKRKE